MSKKKTNISIKKIRKNVMKAGKEYSIESDLDNLEEEAAELIQAIAKYKRAINKKKNYNTTSLSKNKAFDNLVEEIADVEIVIYKIKKKMNISEKEIKKKKVKKIERQKKRNKSWFDKFEKKKKKGK